MSRIDLNCDLGEGAGHDEELLRHVTSANVACGVHAGDPATMRRTVKAARANAVAVGAHPGFADRAGFGRRALSLPPDEVFDLVVEQIGVLRTVTDAEDVELRHVKPHGALYNMAATDPELADAIARAVAACDRNLILFGLAGSELVAAGAHAGLRTASEAFADRSYEPDGSLTPRSDPTGVIHDLDRAVEQAVLLATSKPITTRVGDPLEIACDTICIHGDTPRSPEAAHAIRNALEAAGIEVTPLGT